jgi:ribosomal protein L11 methyltransferase
VDLSPSLVARTAPGGELVLAGILVPQEDEVRLPFLARGLEQLPGERRGEWSMLRFRRPEAG